MENLGSMPSILCTDNATNMKSMGRILDTLWFVYFALVGYANLAFRVGCSVHLINLINMKCLSSCKYTNDLVIKCRKFADSISRSPAKFSIN